MKIYEILINRTKMNTIFFIYKIGFQTVLLTKLEQLTKEIVAIRGEVLKLSIDKSTREPTTQSKFPLSTLEDLVDFESWIVSPDNAHITVRKFF